ncbi:YhcN/YlaJ family sporulation lipoprotein [Alteribacillus sp. JSM 102045]|uniref:YhcN/YlaJ family sporulation lipoprotein n=1 Tax=Alteribacillus sp. JSM 102045 TaxID=1562101 RepID=UPI0035C1B778
MKFLMKSLSLLLTIALFTGCGANQGEQDNQSSEGGGTENLTYNNENQNQTRMEVAEEVADNVESLDEVEQSYVIVANRTAYVAVVLEEEAKQEVRDEVEQKISEEVKSADNNIQNVLVSANPDFVDRMEHYANKLERGEPIEGLFEEFNEMIQRVFPNPRE